MKRIEVILEKLKILTDKIDIEGANENSIGINSSQIVELTKYHRSNVSRDLNKLVKDNKAIKIKGRPTLYLHKKSIEDLKKVSLKNNVFNNIDEFFESIQRDITGTTEKIFIKDNNLIRNTNDKKTNSYNKLIGFNGSLKNQIEQSKAAVLYPPNGLHMLILGETGVGKSTFVESIFSFLKDTVKEKRNSPLVIFNCADYSYNHELIYSQLFGHLKGSYTGADSNKDGVISKAKNGILFLDEIHRLPPEAQEMLFQLIDKGKYRRLGDTKSIKCNNILIIGATTEDPESSILRTFLRRIPVIINLPNLSERPEYEKIELINYFFYKECFRLNENIEVSRHVFLCLLFHKYKSNIGELYSNVQIICAKAYLDKILQNKPFIEINISHVPKILIDSYSRNRFNLEEKYNYYPFEMKEIIKYSCKSNINMLDIKLKNKYNYDYYKMIQNKYVELIEKNISATEIWKKIENNIEEYSDFCMNNKNRKYIDQNIILKFINPDIYFKVFNIIKELPEISHILENQNALYGLMLHIENLIERIKQNRYIRKINNKKIKDNYKMEFVVADKIRKGIEKQFSIIIPEDESSILSIFLHSINTTRSKDNIEILVICHGKNIATDMVYVANSLLGVNHGSAFNMPLDMSTNEIIPKIEDFILKKVKEKGLLILVDMGSLTNIDKLLSDKITYPIEIIDMVNTPLVIEATRKSLIPNMTLDILVSDLKAFTLTKKSLNIDFSINDNSFINKLYSKILRDSFTFLDPKKSINLLNQAFNNISMNFNINYSNTLLIKFLFHSISMIERIIQKEPLHFYKDNSQILRNKEIANSIKKSFKLTEETFGIEIPDSELCYVIEIFLPYIQR